MLSRRPERQTRPPTRWNKSSFTEPVRIPFHLIIVPSELQPDVHFDNLLLFMDIDDLSQRQTKVNIQRATGVGDRRDKRIVL